MSNVLISVIIPVYNVINYLQQCVSSVLEQDYSNLEIILIDDGSTDGSSELCDVLSKNSSIKVIHQENRGLSSARNTGLKYSNGKYVIFMDSDDYWNKTVSLKKLIDIFEANFNMYDFILFNMIYYYQVNNIFKEWPKYSSNIINHTDKNNRITQMICYGIFPMSACSKIIKKEFLVKNQILFMDNYYSEDIPWFIEILIKSKDFLPINEYLYVYRKQVQGTISSSYSLKKYNDLFCIVNMLYNNIMNIDNEELKKAILSFLAYEYSILMGLISYFPKSQRKKMFSNLKKIEILMKYTLHPKVRKVNYLYRFLPMKFTSYILFIYIKYFVNRI